MNEVVHQKLFGVEDYPDDAEEKFPVSLNPPQMIEGLVTMAMRSPPGDFIELGVWRGGTASVLHQIAEQQSRKLHLFDLFESDNCLNAVKRFCPKAYIFKGRFPDSWPGNINNIAFAFFDYYEPDGAEFLINLMPKNFVNGGILLFSQVFNINKALPLGDYNFMHCHGAQYPYLSNKVT